MESITDLQQHIRKRLTEIEDLDERKDAREILLEGLVPIFERMEKRYLDLENQIKREIEIPNEKYAVSMTVIKKGGLRSYQWNAVSGFSCIIAGGQGTGENGTNALPYLLCRQLSEERRI